MPPRKRRDFGTIIEQRGRFRARYADPEGRTRPVSPEAVEKAEAAGRPHPKPEPILHSYPLGTFTTRLDAEAWLASEQRLISAGTWTPPAVRHRARLEAEQRTLPTFKDYAEAWIAGRRNGRTGEALAPRTAEHYRKLLSDYLSPAFGGRLITDVTAADVTAWFEEFTPKAKRHQGKRTQGETTRAHAYSLGRAIFNTACGPHGPMVGMVNPFAVRGGGNTTQRRRDAHTATAADLAVIRSTIAPEWEPIILLGVGCGLRFSEIAELRRRDFDLEEGTVRIERAVADRTGGTKGPKSQMGHRMIDIPDEFLPTVERHVAKVKRPDVLVFPGKGGGHLKPSTFYGKVPGRGWYAARAAAGRTDLTFHDMRATGATILSRNPNMSEAELQAWLGDSTPAAARRYIRATRSRMKSHAKSMSATFAAGDW